MSNIYFKTKTAVNTDASMFSSGLTLVEAAGFEPVAFCSGGRRSIPNATLCQTELCLDNFNKLDYTTKDFLEQ